MESVKMKKKIGLLHILNWVKRGQEPKFHLVAEENLN